MSETRNKLKSIKSTVFSRGLSMTKTTISMGAKIASHAVSGVFSELEKSERLKKLLSSQMEILGRELGELKGSLMKAGQMLSMYGEYFLPPEANEFLRKLQSQSPSLEWPTIEKVLIAELGTEKLALLDVEPEPIGSASLGQVHRAKIKSTGEYISLKVQYPGVEKAIDSDLAALRRLLSVSKLLPKHFATDAIFEEIRIMLKQEVDYDIEKNLTREFAEILKNDKRFKVPVVYDNFSTRHVLATSYEIGLPVLNEEVLKLPQERRNRIGQNVMELYFRELFELGLVQTDPHFGNYLVRIDSEGTNDVLVLLDFGATRRYDLKFLKPYREMNLASIQQDRERVITSCRDLGFLKADDPEEFLEKFVNICYEICEPFYSRGQKWCNEKLTDTEGNYNWAESDLPFRLTKVGTQVALASKFRPPPQEVIFLDRKLTGLFIFLQKLRCNFNPWVPLRKVLK